MSGNQPRQNIQPSLLFVQGVQKTGTSTLVGILNCHPEVFMLYETRMNGTLVSRYANQILERFPEARKFFRRETDFGQPYREFFDFIGTRFADRAYRFVGDKLIDFNVNITDSRPQPKLIFTMRDIRSWLVKEQIVNYYRTDLDVVPATVQYLQYVAGAHHKKNAFRVWMEDLIEDNQQTIERLGDYLELDLARHTGHWWERTATNDLNDPKSLSNWSQGHPSSRMPPTKLDTKVEICSCPFWRDVQGVFDRYFRQSVSNPSLTDRASVETAINQIWKYSPLPLARCYENINTTRFGFAEPTSALATSVSKTSRKRRMRDRIARELKRLVTSRAA